MNKHKRCPFCGSEARCEVSHEQLTHPRPVDGDPATIRYRSRPTYRVSCRNTRCPASVSTFGRSPAAAWRRWDTRATP